MTPWNSPTRLSAGIEAEICELRRRHPRRDARRIVHKLAGRGLGSAPSRATVHRVLSRNSLVRTQEQQHPRKYPRWQREAPMHLWQMDLVGGVPLADGRVDVPLTNRRLDVVVYRADTPSGAALDPAEPCFAEV